MEYQYNAFISYRHTEIDMKVAEDVEKQLEQFRIPASIRKQYGIRRINRLFRDKDELPITSNINDDILKALDHSEYLIVICSPHTKESVWVDREIRRFLETHDRKHVLTVIAEGMPGDVIPEILTYQEVERTAPDGTKYTEKEQLEPLSCDYRIGFRKARKTEVPRLASALIGCRYDDLIQRRKQRRNRIFAGLMAAVTVVSTAAAAYVIRANSRISENYRQSLRNQSEYLSSESLTALENGDRMTAVHLALEALPSEENDRPYTAKAEYALTQALRAYVLSGDTLSVTGSYVHTASVNNFMVSDDEKILVSLDDSNTVYIYDTDTLKLRNSIHIDKDSGYVDIELLGFCSDRIFLFKKDEIVYAYDVMTGEQLYILDGTEEYSEPTAMFVKSADSRYSRIVLCYYNDKIAVYDPENGSKIMECSIPLLPEGLSGFDDYPGITEEAAVSEDGRYIALTTLFDVGEGFMESDYGLAVIDLKEGEMSVLPVDSKYISCIGFYNDRIIFYELDEEPDTFNTTGMLEGAMIITNSPGHVNAVSTSGEVLWRSPVSTSQLSYYERIVPVHMENSECIVWCHADQVILFDPDTGKITEKCEMTDSVKSMKVFPSVIAVVTADGRLTTISPDEPSPWFSQPYLISGISKASAGRRDWIITDNDKVIIQYDWNSTTAPIEVIESEKEVQYFSKSNSFVNDDGMLFFLGGEVYYSDGNRDSVLKYADISEQLTVLEYFSYDSSTFTLVYGDEICRINRITDEITYETIEPDEGYYLRSDVYPLKDCLYYIAGSEQNTYLVKEEKEKKQQIELPFTAEIYSRWRAAVSPDGNTVILVCSTDDMIYGFLTDCKTGKTVSLENTEFLKRKVLAESTYENLTKYTAFSSDSSLLAAAGETSVEIFDAAGNIKTVLKDLRSSAASMCFTPDNRYLLTASEDGRLYRYDIQSGKMLDYTDLEASYSSVRNFSWQFAGDYLLLNCDGDMNVINLDEMQITAVIEVICYGYLSACDSFVCGDSDILATVRRYTVEELISMGREYLNGHELTEEQKSEYGLQSKAAG